MSLISLSAFTLALIFPSPASALASIRVTGSFNGFSINDTAMSTGTGPDAGRWKLTAQIFYTSAASDTAWKFVAPVGSWATDHWGGNGAGADIAMPAFNTIFAANHNGGAGAESGKWTGAWDSNKWYTFRFADAGSASTNATVMQTDNAPISISTVTPATTPYAYIPARVNVTISGAKSQQEKVIVRYTVNGWITSDTVLCDSTAATAYYADIPGFAAGTKVIYYVLTSTAATSTDWDLQTLAYNTNGGSNYTYTVLPPNVTHHTVYPPTGVYGRYGGGSQFAGSERVRTTAGATAYLTWDTNNIYAAFTGGTGNTDSYIVMVDTNPGIASGALPTDTYAGRGYWGNTFRPDVAFTAASSVLRRQAANTAGTWQIPTDVTASCTSLFGYDSGAGAADSIVIGIPRSLVGLANPTDSAAFWIYAVSSPSTVWAIFDSTTDGKLYTTGTDSGMILFETSSIPSAPPSPIAPTDGQTTVASRRPTISWNVATPGDPADSIIDYYFEIATDSNFSDTTSFPLEVGWRGATNSITCTTTLAANTWYYWRVKAKETGGGVGSFSSSWSFKINTIIAVDGSLTDWNSTEKFPTLNANGFYLTWDSTYLYGAWDRGTTFETTDVVFMYIDTAAGGSSSAINWNGGGSHLLPFSADIEINYRQRNLSQDFDYQVWNGAGWTFKDTAGTEYKNGTTNVLEWSVPWSIIGPATTQFKVIMYVENEYNSNYMFSPAPATNPQGAAPQEFSAYLQFDRSTMNSSSNDRYYYRSSRTWQAEAPSPASFSPIVDGIKDAAWGNTPSATSSSYRLPAPGYGDTNPPMTVAAGGLCRDVYVTNDAQWLYIGWQATGDVFALDEPGQTAQSAHYGFAITDTSSYGSPQDPWKSGGTTFVSGYGADVWTNLFANFNVTTYSDCNRYTTLGAAWNVSAITVANQDYGGYLPSIAQGWGEIRIPLSNISPTLRIGDSIAIIHYSRHNGSKGGADDATPFISSGTSDWAVSNAHLQFRDTAVIVYAIKRGVIDASHIPDTTPVQGLRLMRYPETTTVGVPANLLLKAKPTGIVTSATVIYSTDSGGAWTSVALAEEVTSGEATYWSGFLPSFVKDSIVLYYFAINSSQMTTYLYGADTWSVPTASQATAIANPFRFSISNAAPTPPTSVDITPRVPTGNDTLVVTTSGGADSDAVDLLRYTFSWYRNGVFQFSSVDSYAPYTSEVSPALTSAGDTWSVLVTLSDGWDTTASVSGPIVRISTMAVWSGALPSEANRATQSTTGGITEWIWRDRTGEAFGATDAYDLREVRVQADTTYMYFLFRMGSYPLDGVHVAVAIDTTNGSPGGNEIGDQTSTLLDSGILSPPMRYERQFIVHAVTPGSLSVELDTAAGAGNNWISPPGGSVISADPVAGLVEVRLSRADLMLNGTCTPRFAFATFGNFLGAAATANTSGFTGYSNPSDVLDAVSRTKTGLNDTRHFTIGSTEDFDDADLDFAPQINLWDTSVAPNMPPGSTPLELPATGDTVYSNPPTLTWSTPADTDAGDTIIAYIVEFADSGTPLDGNVLYRVSIAASGLTLYSIPDFIPDSIYYTWRVRPVDRAGNIGEGAPQTFFLHDATSILVNSPTDLQNMNNMRRMNGDEVAGTTIRWNWVGATHSDSAPITAYVIQIDTSTSFTSPIDSRTLPNTARLYTWTSAQRGYTYYARILAYDTGTGIGTSPTSDGIYVSRREVNGDSSDWAPTGGYAFLSANLNASYAEGIWTDSNGDQRGDVANSTSRDIVQFQVTADPYNLYFLVPTTAFVDGATLGQIAISYENSSDVRAFQGNGTYSEDSFTTTKWAWENLVRWRTGNDDCFAMNTYYTATPARYTENTSSKYVELCVPFSAIGGSDNILGRQVAFTVASFYNNGGAVGTNGAGNSNVVDAVSSGLSTWPDEVNGSDPIVNYTLLTTFDTGGRVTAFSGGLETASYTPNLPTQNGDPVQSQLDLIMYNVFIDRFVSGRNDNPPPD
ncbi:MAG: hypothetical protein AAB229_06200, partial [Candidatus Hydrogenedentota bacterium]